MKDSSEHVLYDIVDEWKKSTDIEMEKISPGRSLMKHHTKYNDTYLKYIQFRTFHKKCYTNEKL